MAALFGRTGSLTLGTTKINFAIGAGEAGTLAVEFRVKKNLKPEPNGVELRVWNLSADTRKSIETPKLVPVQLDVGYGGDNHTIYLGQLRSAESVIDGPHVITSISSGDNDAAFGANRINVSVPAAATPAQILSTVAGATGVGKGNVAAVASLVTGGFAGCARKLHGVASTIMGQTARANGMEWSVQDGALQVIPIGSTVGGTTSAVVLSATSGMIGSPTVDNKGIVTAKSLIQPGLFPGMPVVIQGALLQGTYRIETAEFSGATWGADWTVTIHGKKWK